MDEARRVARLRHPSIVPIHDVGEFKGRLFLVFDLIGDRGSESFIHFNGRLPPNHQPTVIGLKMASPNLLVNRGFHSTTTA